MHTHIAEWVKFVLFLVPPGGLLFMVGLASSTTVTYLFWHPNMVALGAISSKLSLTPRESPVRCVRSGMLSDFDS